MYDFINVCFMQVDARNVPENLRRKVDGIDRELLASRPTRLMLLCENVSARLIKLGERLQTLSGKIEHHVEFKVSSTGAN